MSCTLSASVHAYPNQYNNGRYTQASTTATLKQPKVRWYRYYGPSGEPNLSSTITAQHLRYGYEALDSNMQVVKQAAPYSPAQYAKQKKKQEALLAKREADLVLRRTYGSAAQATAKRDQMLADMASRKTYLQTQLAGLQAALNNSITQAATFDRQKKPLPAYLKTLLDDTKQNIVEAERNIESLTIREKQVNQEYEHIIQRLRQFKQ